MSSNNVDVIDENDCRGAVSAPGGNKTIKLRIKRMYKGKKWNKRSVAHRQDGDQELQEKIDKIKL